MRYLRCMWSNRDEIHDRRQETHIRVYEAASRSCSPSPKPFLFTTTPPLATAQSCIKHQLPARGPTYK